MTNTNEKKPSVLLKPQADTPFHIDFDWWKETDNSWRVVLKSYLCEEHKAFFEANGEDQFVDSVNPETGEVTQVDQLQDILYTHCSQQENFIVPNAALTDSVFRVFISNGNTPLNCEQIGQLINRPAETILKTLSGLRVYRGIRPIL